MPETCGPAGIGTSILAQTGPTDALYQETQGQPCCRQASPPTHGEAGEVPKFLGPKGTPPAAVGKSWLQKQTAPNAKTLSVTF